MIEFRVNSEISYSRSKAYLIIEIVIIKIDNASQLNASINLALLSNFKKLKYIYIVSSITISSNEIANMITNYDEKYSVFYKIDKGDNQ